MQDQFSYKGYKFIIIDSVNPQRPYNVRCIETGDIKDSAISYMDAAGLIICSVLFAKNKLENDSKNKEYVYRVFVEKFIGRKKSECDKIVNEILERQLINGNIIKLSEKEKYSQILEYYTENFKIGVHFEKGLFCGATKVTVDCI